MIKVLTDSSCDLPDETLAEFNIEMMPLKVTFDNGDTFLDRIEITPAEFQRRMYTSRTLPKTSTPDPKTFLEAFERGAIDGAIYIALSSGLSGTYQTALMAKQMLNSDKIKIVDSLSASLGVGMLAVKAAELVKQGLNLNDVLREITACRDRMETVFTLNNLDNIIKGGRLTKFQGLVGNLLDIKPIFRGIDGKVEVVEKVRGRRKSLTRMIRLLSEFSEGIYNRMVSISHVDCMDDVDFIKKELENYSLQKIMVSDMGSTIGTYAGKGGIIMSCF